MSNRRESISIDILPTYQCNYRCPYCFLGNLRNDNTVLNLDLCIQRLEEINKIYNISTINLYGGEISLLHINYIDRLIDIVSYYVTPNIVTNLSDWNFLSYLEKKDVTISTSLNDDRENNDLLERRLYDHDCSNISILQVVTPSLLTEDRNRLSNRLYLSNASFSFLRYSPSTKADIKYSLNNRDYAMFIKELIIHFPGRIENENELKQCLSGAYNPRMSSNIFINPQGKLMSVQYNSEHLEYFREYNSLEDWIIDCDIEYKLYRKHCRECRYFNHCYAEHLSFNNIIDDDCCGMYQLLNWYENK